MSTKPETSAAKDDSPAPLSADALARRRALLSGLGKGGAVLAAAVPIQSLASSTVLTCKNQGGHTVIATVSGAQSAVHSFVAGGGVVQVPACGKKISYWCKASNWPSNCSTSTKYRDVFGSNPSNGNSDTTCWTVVNNESTYGDCSHWVAAYLNGCSQYQSGAGIFPYPHVKTGNLNGVADWYKDSYNRDKALALFKTIQTGT